MTEYISKQAVLDYLNGYLHSLGGGGADTLLFDRGQRRALINSIQDIMAVKAADVQPVDRWISVKDRLPENDNDVLVYDTDCGIVIGWYDKEIGDFAADFISPLDAVTHWQPLPEPPKESETE
jgi:hypothetical protein